jgi:hypothetical protein
MSSAPFPVHTSPETGNLVGWYSNLNPSSAERMWATPLGPLWWRRATENKLRSVLMEHKHDACGHTDCRDRYIWGLCLGPHAGTAGPGQACMLTWVCEAIVRTGEREHMAKSCGNVAELEGRGTQSSGLPTLQTKCYQLKQNLAIGATQRTWRSSPKFVSRHIFLAHLSACEIHTLKIQIHGNTSVVWLDIMYTELQWSYWFK